MESTASRRGTARRPGGRTAQVTQRVLDAVLDLLVEGGVAACSYRNVAERAQVERSTLYRRYPDRWEMMIDAFMARAAADIMPPLAGSFAKDLKAVLTRLVEQLELPIGPALIGVAAELRAAHASDFSRAYFDRRMRQLDPMFDAAVRRGELAADVDRERLFSLAAGPIYFRMFIAGRRVEPEWIERTVADVCRLFRKPA